MSRIPRPARGSARHRIPFLLVAMALSACSDRLPVGAEIDPPIQVPETALQALSCTGTTDGSISCGGVTPDAGGASRVLIGGQNRYVKLTSSNASYNAATEIYQFDVTVQNLLNEAIGTPDGIMPDPQGIQVFFARGPTVTQGTGTVTVENADGTAFFTRASEPYFAYHSILPKDAVSPAKTWKLRVPPTVSRFSFMVYIETDVQYLLTINEVLVNPGGTISDANGEWFELYNAGTLKVDLQNLVIADSAASGRRPYHLVASSVVVPPGGYVVLGNTSNTTSNGGVPMDYSYGSALTLANSLDAIKISRVFGADTLTIDRTQYASAAVSAENGISRELTNPWLDNQNMDGNNWASALVTAVYGPGGRGTPRAQNSTYTP